MTLADFARSIGISPVTARQWKRRGKIVERDSEFVLVDRDVTERDASVTAPLQCDANVTDIECDIVVEMPPKSVTPSVVVTREAFEALLSRLDACERDSVTPETCAGCEELRRDLAEMREWINNLQHGFQDRLRLLEGKTSGPHPSWSPSRRGLMDPPSSDWGA